MDGQFITLGEWTVAVRHIVRVQTVAGGIMQVFLSDGHMIAVTGEDESRLRNFLNKVEISSG